MKLHHLWLPLALLAAGTAALAQWQWLDKDGHKVFSDRAPPADIPEKNILTRPAPPKKDRSPGESQAAAPNGAASGTAAATSPSPNTTENAPLARPGLSAADKDLEARKKQMAEAEVSKRQAAEASQAKARAENCNRARQARATLESGVRMAQTNARGEREFMDDAARAAEQQRIQTIIASECR